MPLTDTGSPGSGKERASVPPDRHLTGGPLSRSSGTESPERAEASAKAFSGSLASWAALVSDWRGRIDDPQHRHRVGARGHDVRARVEHLPDRPGLIVIVGVEPQHGTEPFDRDRVVPLVRASSSAASTTSASTSRSVGDDECEIRGDFPRPVSPAETFDHSRKTMTDLSCRHRGAGLRFHPRRRGNPAAARIKRFGEVRAAPRPWCGNLEPPGNRGRQGRSEVGRGSFGIVERPSNGGCKNPQGLLGDGEVAIFGSHTCRRLRPSARTPFGVGSPARHRMGESPERVEASAKAPSGLSRCVGPLPIGALASGDARRDPLRHPR